MSNEIIKRKIGRPPISESGKTERIGFTLDQESCHFFRDHCHKLNLSYSEAFRLLIKKIKDDCNEKEQTRKEIKKT